MRFNVGPIPKDASFEPEADGDWVRLREPTPWLFQLLAAPVGIAAVLLLLKSWSYAVPWPPSREVLGAEMLAFGPILLATIPIHEFIHALGHPHWGRSDSSVYGFWPKTLLFYAHYTGEMSRNRLLAILLAPVVCLSIGPVLLAASLGVWHWVLVVVSVANILAAAGDLTGSLLLATQVPAMAIVRNQGYYTWWRP